MAPMLMHSALKSACHAAIRAKSMSGKCSRIAIKGREEQLQIDQHFNIYILNHMNSIRHFDWFGGICAQRIFTFFRHRCCTPLFAKTQFAAEGNTSDRKVCSRTLLSLPYYVTYGHGYGYNVSSQYIE